MRCMERFNSHQQIYMYVVMDGLLRSKSGPCEISCYMYMYMYMSHDMYTVSQCYKHSCIVRLHCQLSNL